MTERSLVDGIVDLTTFELLERIAASGSLTTAAAAMGVSQQAASARLSRAERSLGRALVVRGVTGSVLTEDGRVVLGWAVPVLEAARRAAVSLEALRRVAAPVTVAASQTVAELLLPGWLQKLRGVEPGAVVRLVSGNTEQVVAAVRAGSAQLGFIEGPETPDGLRTATVALDELMVVVPIDHPWAVEAPSIRELAATPLVLREAGSGTRATFESWLREQGLSAAPPAAELGTTSAIRAAVVAGMAPAVLSRLAVAEDVRSGALRAVTVAGPPPRRRIAAVWTGPTPIGVAAALVRIAQEAQAAVA